jgi:hypothetical protein
MKCIILAATLVAYTFAIPASDRGDGPNYWFEFGRFVQRYGKTYASDEEFSSRYGVFKNWLNVIETHNAQEGQTYQLAVNQFADLTWEEFRSLCESVLFNASCAVVTLFSAISSVSSATTTAPTNPALLLIQSIP